MVDKAINTTVNITMNLITRRARSDSIAIMPSNEQNIRAKRIVSKTDHIIFFFNGLRKNGVAG